MLYRWFITLLLVVADFAWAQSPATRPAGPGPVSPATHPAKAQDELEAELAQLLSGATLEGSFNSTGPGSDPTQISSDQYNLGTVRKLAGKMWLIQARIGYRGNDVMVPLPLPIEWAGDTPVIIVDNLTIPGMGTFNARVMFFDGHYSGYWKHGDRGGNLFGVIRHPTTMPPKSAQ